MAGPAGPAGLLCGIFAGSLGRLAGSSEPPDVCMALLLAHGGAAQDLGGVTEPPGADPHAGWGGRGVTSGGRALSDT